MGGVSGSAVSQWSEGLCALSLTYKVLHRPINVCHEYYIFKTKNKKIHVRFNNIK